MSIETNGEVDAMKGGETPVVKYPHLFMMLHVSNSPEACALYHTAFGAVKLSEDRVGDDAYIMIDINGFPILVRPGTADRQFCCAKFACEDDLRRTYDILTQEGTGRFQDAHWTSLLAFVTDKYGVDWQLSV